VRLHGIDAPESNQPYRREASMLLADLITGQEVQIEVVEQQGAYDLLLGRIYVGETDANAEMINRGAAYAERRYLRQVEDGETYCHFEGAARTSKRGIWRLLAERRIAPWEWRDGADAFTDYSDETVENSSAPLARRERLRAGLRNVYLHSRGQRPRSHAARDRRARRSLHETKLNSSSSGAASPDWIATATASPVRRFAASLMMGAPRDGAAIHMPFTAR
jgi:hypothetical protein